MRILIAALVAVFFVSAPAFAAEPKECPTNTFPIARLDQFLDRTGLVAVEEYKGDTAVAVVRGFNAMPPATDFRPDRVIVYGGREHRLLVFYIGDCVTGPPPMLTHVFDRFIEQMAGQGV